MRRGTLTDGSRARAQPGRVAAIALALLALPMVAVGQQEPTAEGAAAGGVATQTLAVGADRPPLLLVRVIEAETGLPIPGLQVFLTGTEIGGVTDEAGRFDAYAPESGTWRIGFRQIGRVDESVELELARSTVTQVLAALRLQRVPEGGPRLLPPLPGASRGAPPDTAVSR